MKKKPYILQNPNPTWSTIWKTTKKKKSKKKSNKKKCCKCPKSSRKRK